MDIDVPNFFRFNKANDWKLVNFGHSSQVNNVKAVKFAAILQNTKLDLALIKNSGLLHDSIKAFASRLLDYLRQRDIPTLKTTTSKTSTPKSPTPKPSTTLPMPPTMTFSLLSNTCLKNSFVGYYAKLIQIINGQM